MANTTYTRFRPRYSRLLRDTMRARTLAARANDWETFQALTADITAITTVMADLGGETS